MRLNSAALAVCAGSFEPLQMTLASCLRKPTDETAEPILTHNSSTFLSLREVHTFGVYNNDVTIFNG